MGVAGPCLVAFFGKTVDAFTKRKDVASTFTNNIQALCDKITKIEQKLESDNKRITDNEKVLATHQYRLDDMQERLNR